MDSPGRLPFAVTLALGSMFNGCRSPVRLYEGPGLPAEEVAVVRFRSVQERARSPGTGAVEPGSSMPRLYVPKDGRPVRRSATKVELKPGLMELWIGTEHQFQKIHHRSAAQRRKAEAANRVACCLFPVCFVSEVAVLGGAALGGADVDDVTPGAESAALFDTLYTSDPGGSYVTHHGRSFEPKEPCRFVVEAGHRYLLTTLVTPDSNASPTVMLLDLTRETQQKEKDGSGVLGPTPVRQYAHPRGAWTQVK